MTRGYRQTIDVVKIIHLYADSPTSPEVNIKQRSNMVEIDQLTLDFLNPVDPESYRQELEAIEAIEQEVSDVEVRSWKAIAYAL